MSNLVLHYRRARRAALRTAYERGDLEDTYGRVELEELGVVAGPDRLHYEPSGWRFLRRALRGRRIGPQDAFIDYGCGKGRVVYQAATRYPFARVIGLEIAPDLARVARENIDRNRARLRAGAVEVVCGDAATYPVPDEVTYAYLYNPFLAPTFGRVVDRLRESLERRPRRLTVLYGNPQMAGAVQASGVFDLRDVIAPGRGRMERTIHVYESRGTHHADA